MDDFGYAPTKAEGDCIRYDKDSGEDTEVFVAPAIEVLGDNCDIGYHDIPRPTTQYICRCGCKSFSAHYVAGGYETSVFCTECGKGYVVHEG